MTSRRTPARPRRLSPDDTAPTRPRARVLAGWAAGRVGFVVERFKIRETRYLTIFFPELDLTCSVEESEVEEAAL